MIPHPLRRTAVAVLASLSLAGLAGCGGDDASSTASSTAAKAPAVAAAPRTVPDGMGSTAKDGAFPRTVRHFGGSTTIPARPRRVVVISTGQMDAALRLGVVPVGTTSGDGAALVPPYLQRAFPARRAAIARIADVGTRFEPNLEAISDLRPDLILLNEAGAEAVYDKLAAIAPTVMTEGTGVKWKQDDLLMADALGRRQQAQRDLDAYHADAAKLGDELGGDAPTVSFVRFNAAKTRVFGVGSFVGSIAQDAGLPRPKSQTFAATSEEISEEQLDRADADRILYGAQSGRNTAAKALDREIWKSLGAVRAGHAVRVDDDAWYLNAGPVAAEAVLAGLRTALR